MTRGEVQHLRAMLEVALSNIEIEGFTLKLGNCTFGATATFKLEVCPTSEDGTVVTREAEDFKLLAHLYGFKKDDLGREFRSSGQTFKIIGWRTKARKTPVIAERSDGKKFVFPADTVRGLLALTVQA